MIPMIFDFFETRMHFEYLINGTKTFAGVSKSTIGGIGSIVSDNLAFLSSASPLSAKCFTIPSSDITPAISEPLKTGLVFPQGFGIPGRRQPQDLIPGLGPKRFLAVQREKNQNISILGW